jgi:hypothetical protein
VGREARPSALSLSNAAPVVGGGPSSATAVAVGDDQALTLRDPA